MRCVSEGVKHFVLKPLLPPLIPVEMQTVISIIIPIKNIANACIILMSTIAYSNQTAYTISYTEVALDILHGK